ncbi:MAG: TonB family protein [Porticoccaceae bacterium]|nr:TonB family protein [Porticoccaceae bacterium]
MGKMASYIIAILLSIALHLVVIVALLINWQPQSKKIIVQPQYIQAQLVELAAKKKPSQKKQVKPAVDLQAKKRAMEKRRAAEQKRAEQKRRALLKEQQAQQKVEQARKAREEKQRLAEIERTRREAEFAETLRQEQALLNAEEDKKVANSYLQLIQKRLSQHWSRPPSARRGMEALIELKLVPTGRIAGVKILQSSGDVAFNRAVEQAAFKAEQFEELQKMDARVFEQYFRSVKVVFSPEDLRL